VREASEAADEVISADQGDGWPEFCAQVLAGLHDWRERWCGSEFSDPGGLALWRFISALETVTGCDGLSPDRSGCQGT